MFSESVTDALRILSSSLRIPTIIILIALIVLTLVTLGSFFVEIFSERRTLKQNIPALVDLIQEKNLSEIKDIITQSGLLKRQKKAVNQLLDRSSYPADVRESLARQLIAEEESRYLKITRVTDLIARIAPMFGLMGTLIPLGPGIVALAQGDTKTLSDSIMVAFDTTVAGLISAAVAFVISSIRKGWYEQYMVGLETIMETILTKQETEGRSDR